MFSRERVPIVETQVKERLTGAVILVTLIVLLVPELLTGGPGKSSPSPAPDAAAPGGAAGEPAVRTYSIDLVQGGVQRQAASPSDELDLSAREVTKPTDADATVEPAKVAAEQASAQPRPLVSGSAAAESRLAEPAGKPSVPVGPKPALPKSAPPREAPPKAAKAAPAPAARAMPETASGAAAKGWAVQLGSFASRDNAQRLAKQLKGKGYDAYVLGGGGSSGKLYRVRVGPEPDRAAADALAARLRSQGQKGSVVAQP